MNDGTKIGPTLADNTPANEVDVVVLIESIRAISERFANTAYGFFLGKRVAYPIVANYVRNTWGKYGLEECPKNIGSGEAKNLKKPSQTLRGVLVGPKVRFQLAKQVYKPVSKMPTANTSRNKKKNMESTKEVSKSNPFDVLNSVENDVDLVVLVLLLLLRKLIRLIIDGKVTFVDDEGKPLEKVNSSGDYDSEDEVALVDNEMASFWLLRRMAMAKKFLKSFNLFAIIWISKLEVVIEIVSLGVHGKLLRLTSLSVAWVTRRDSPY
ncbi:hypothetical protein Tco_1126569 [Tanacetum coccineum]